MTTQTLVVAAVCFRDAADRILTVRKRGTGCFMLPGGKSEPGEGSEAAALREVHEELGVTVRSEDLALLGSWTGTAANELDTLVDATVYLSTVVITPVASAEIVELRWVDPTATSEPEFPIAPLLTDFVFPSLAA
ncbi:8-oxo-dGTP pyrophosphatase MutT, NUDIX family [Cryobacterium flavum]|uniref:8-oxo-dGTP pyrophosphatase MutT, NUDIX family n=1 Tax=Cryobacterium flavum TaxID=1424659 RepID=A0A4R8VIN7_9MICO|nr:NUDIX domain-containing protein [Cryobacterium flavum]TFB82392.1 NUDIX domain-containing protein [Cryobacterium flavum]SDO50335.1 8-oxo-dGTP pyrophosphatase MutT, NUDIX family [Cryobacterium flavum]